MSLRILIWKEIQIELRRKSVISGLLLYLACMTFIYYTTFSSQLAPMTWSALYWVTILFTVVSTTTKSFMGEQKGRDTYYYSLLSPESIITSKILYNFALSAIMASFGFVLFALLLSNPITDGWLFLITILLASHGFSGSFTLLSGISSRAASGSVLMAVLGFPIVIGVLVLAITVTQNCIDGLDRSVSYNELLILIAINLLVSAVSYLLFPYIWRS